jgi:hypothetical protein
MPQATSADDLLSRDHMFCHATQVACDMWRAYSEWRKPHESNLGVRRRLPDSAADR